MSVGSSEPREALVGCSASSAAALQSMRLGELPYVWGKACGSWKRLGNLGLIQDMKMTISSSSSHPPCPFGFLPRPWLVPSLLLPYLGLKFYSLMLLLLPPCLGLLV